MEKDAKSQLLLKQAAREGRGRLTIFLGAAAGVGKTYAMLKEAHSKLEAGVDVVIGFVLGHGRPETEALIKGLPQQPLRELTYKGASLWEPDIEGLLARRPSLVIIDELAHTNAPGSKYKYRYKDVEELLNNGIDVYTALNIQHLASLNDIVAQITGTIVQETVPDEFIATADAVKLIDIPPEDLRQRLREGKVYGQAQAERALKSFFRQGNISALRELALRYTASRVDEATTEYMRLHNIPGPWPTSGKVMVCAGSSPFAAQLIRTGARLAKGLHAELLVVNIEIPEQRFPVGDKERERIWKNLRLAEDLGGKVISVFGEDVVAALLEAARNNNVSSIVIGKSRASSWQDRFKKSLVDRLIESSGSIPVYVVNATAEGEQGTVVTTRAQAGQKVKIRELAYAAFLIAGITVFMQQALAYMELVNIALMYLLPVLISAMWWGRLNAYLTTIASILVFEFYFLEPTYTFVIEDLRYMWSFVLFFAVAHVVSQRTERLRKQVVATAQREQAVNELLSFSREITILDNTQTILDSFVNQLSANIKRPVAVLLPKEQKQLELVAASEEKEQLSDSELAVAQWAFDHGAIAGCSTNTLPRATNLYFPLLSQGEAQGAIAIGLREGQLSLAERQMLEGWINLLALQLQKATLAQKARQAEMLEKSDRLRTALFNSVSHELRTPLATIMGAIYTLQDKRVNCSEEMTKQLLADISQGGRRMERIITNLLDTARMESGMLQLKRQWCDFEDVISGALRKWGGNREDHELKFQLPEDLPLFQGDAGLLEHVVLNFLDNAAKYSQVGSQILIKAQTKQDQLVLEVYDEGCGFSEEDKPYLFEKFFRARCTDKASGSGLGLAICRSIIEAHGGSIWADHRQDCQGSIFAFSIPIEAQEEGVNHERGK